MLITSYSNDQILVMTGFEPVKHMHGILSTTPLTTREHYLLKPCRGLEPLTLRLKV
jgi:hypothetical protein